MNTPTLKTKNWVLWFSAGIILVILGLLLSSMPVITSLASVVVLASLLIIAGLINLVTAFLEKDSNHTWLHLVLAALTLVTGLLILWRPAVVLIALTLLIAAFLLSSGLFRIIGAIDTRFRGWGWYLLNGIISFLLGILILSQWPISSFWIIGLFVGIDFIFAGWSLIMVSLLMKKKLLPV